MRGVRTRAGRASERVLEGVAGTDFRARLGVSLTQALIELNSRRHDAPLSTGVAAAPAPNRRPIIGYAVRFRKPIAVGIALLTVGGAGAAASSLWLSPAGNPLYGFTPGLTESAPPAAQLAALSVLRRAQTDSDRVSGVQAALTDVNNFTTGIRSNYVRVLGTTSAGPVVLVPVQTRNAAAGQPAIQNALCVYYPASGPVAQNQIGCWSTQQVLAGQASGITNSHEYGLAPDGVSSVSVSLGSWTKSVALSGNFFDVQVPAAGGGNQPPSLPGTPTVTLSRG
jgi:hypothetical protein